MEYSNLEDLEAKITKIMERMKALRSENDELRKANQTIESKCHELEKALDKTKQTLSILESEKSKWIDGHKEQQDRIRAKVSSLLDKLEEWDN